MVTESINIQVVIKNNNVFLYLIKNKIKKIDFDLRKIEKRNARDKSDCIFDHKNER